MSRHFFSEIDRLKDLLVDLGARAEDSVRRAVRSLEEEDLDLARSVIEADAEIDAREVRIEEETLKVMALHQPVAVDLRFLVCVLKINNDLERIGDLAVNIAECALRIQGRGRNRAALDFTAMAERVQAMLTGSIDAFVKLDADKANAVCAADDEVDRMNRDRVESVRETLQQCPPADEVNALIDLLGVCRSLERVADHATNIAEDLVYMVEGQIVRHHFAHQKG